MVKVKSLRGTEKPSDLSHWVPATQGQGVGVGGVDQDPEAAGTWTLTAYLISDLPRLPLRTGLTHPPLTGCL